MDVYEALSTLRDLGRFSYGPARNRLRTALCMPSHSYEINASSPYNLT